MSSLLSLDVFETLFDPLDLPPVDQLVNPSETMPVVGSLACGPHMPCAGAQTCVRSAIPPLATGRNTTFHLFSRYFTHQERRSTSCSGTQREWNSSFPKILSEKEFRDG